MTINSRNQFAIFSEDDVEVVSPAQSDKMKKSGADKKKSAIKPPTPSQAKSSNDRNQSDRKPANKQGLGGLASPRPSRGDAPTGGANFISSDHIKEESRPSKAHARPHREAPVHGRELDRHSATGRVDGEKKSVAGHSWGKPIDVPEGVSAEEALEIVESDKAEVSGKQPGATASEETPAAPPAEVLKSYDSYLGQQRAKKSALSQLKQEPRRPNEGNFDSKEHAPLKLLSKSGIKDTDSLAGLLKGSPKSSSKKNKKEKKEKETIAIEPRFSFDKSQRPTRGAPRGGQGGGPRSQFNNRPATATS